MRKILLVLLLLALMLSTTAFVHVTIPAQDCAAEASGGNAGNNSTAKSALVSAGVPLPAGGADKNTPDPCG